MIDREDIPVIKNILNIHNENVDTTLLYNVLTAIKEDPNLEGSLLDSFSSNQFAAKTALLDAVNNLNILDKDSTVAIWGSWYGSILIPLLADKVKRITCIDLDQQPLQIAKNRLFDNYKNIDYICDDVFKSCRKSYLETNLIINTSCEHMPPMKDWKWFERGALKQDNVIGKDPKISDNCYFVFQSNNMFGIEGHINCVNSLQEFKEQMPERAEVLFEEEVEDTRGTRYMLVGKFNPL
jgi:hypothetical protein